MNCEIKQHKLFNDDCLNILPQMESESIDLVVTDCPYRIVSGGIRVVDAGDECGGVLNKRDYSKTDPKGVLSRGRRIVVADGSNIGARWIKKGGEIPCAVRDGKMFEHNEIKFEEWLPEVYRILKPRTHCYIMINSRNLKELQTKAEDVGFSFQNLLAWDKGNVTPNQYYMQGLEFILMLSKRPAKPINNRGSKTLISIKNVKNKKHPTEKPVELMRHLVGNSSTIGDVVVDPFMGVGSTILACDDLNRAGIGIEIDEEFYNISVERMTTTKQESFI